MSFLQKAGVEVVVLELSSQVGGRFAAASGCVAHMSPSQADSDAVAVGLGPEALLPGSSLPEHLDPIRLLARQLGLTLTPAAAAGKALVLYDPGSGGHLSEEDATAAERWVGPVAAAAAATWVCEVGW